MRTFLIGSFFFVSTLAWGQSLTVDKTAIRFVGTGCKGLTSEQVSFAGDRLVIDLQGMDPLTRINPRASCLIKIPYQGGKGRSTITLDGHYALAPEDQLALSWRFDAAGALGPAKILSLSETSKGRLSWQDSLSFDQAPTEEAKDKGLLRISLYMDWKSGVSPGANSPQSQKEKEADQDLRPLHLKELTLTSVGSAGDGYIPGSLKDLRSIPNAKKPQQAIEA